MHRHENLAEVLLGLKGQRSHTVDLRRQELMFSDIVLCNGGTVHDEFPEAESSYQWLYVGCREPLSAGTAVSLPDWNVFIIAAKTLP